MSYFPTNVRKARKFIKEYIMKKEKEEAEDLARIKANCLRIGIIEDIRKERSRQMAKEWFDAGHDKEHGPGVLALAGACYASRAFWDDPHRIPLPIDWPWSKKWWKPKTPRKDLIRAAALIIAELEKLDCGENGRP